jgi:hypothetical protein
MKRCVNCHKYIYYPTDTSWCGCERVTAWMPSQRETEEDAEEHFTKDSEELATEIAEDFWNDDPSDPTKFKVTVAIRGRQGGLETFEVTAEVSVDFSASPVKGEV